MGWRWFLWGWRRFRTGEDEVRKEVEGGIGMRLGER